MARLPTVGGDSGNWGSVLNEFLQVAINTDGTLKDTGTLATKVNVASAPVQFSAATATTGVTGSDRAYVARTLTGARMRVATAPSGSALTVAVQHFDGFTWTTIGTLTMADGTSIEQTATFSQAQAVGNLIRLNISSVGSTSAAAGVTVEVLWTNA
jgi:hypothetical protein